MKRVVLLFLRRKFLLRSQLLAEAFAKIHGAEKVEAFSAGSRPSGRVNPKAVETMRELGYDLGSAPRRNRSQRTSGDAEFEAQRSRWVAATHVRSCARKSAKIGASPIPRICRRKTSVKCENSIETKAALLARMWVARHLLLAAPVSSRKIIATSVWHSPRAATSRAARATQYAHGPGGGGAGASDGCETPSNSISFTFD